MSAGYAREVKAWADALAAARADAERLAASLRSLRHTDTTGAHHIDCRQCAALAAHDALTGDKK